MMHGGSTRKHAKARRRQFASENMMESTDQENKDTSCTGMQGTMSCCCHRKGQKVLQTSTQVLSGPNISEAMGALKLKESSRQILNSNVTPDNWTIPPPVKISFAASKKHTDITKVGPKGECIVCGIFCTLSCSGCRKVYYCGRDHQRKNWNEGHKLVCYPWNDMSPEEHEGQIGPLGKGPFIKASKDFQAMEIIYEDLPLMTGPGCCAETDYEPVCLGCSSIIKEFQKCSLCRWPVCGPHCETGNIHAKYECEIFAKNHVQELFHPFQYELVRILRCLLTKNKEPAIFDQLLHLDGALEQREKLDFLIEASKTACMFVKSNCKLTEFDEGTINHMCGVVDLQTRPFGRFCSIMQIFSFPTVLLHACDPNVRFIEVIRPNGETVLEAVAVRHIKKGEPLTQSLVINVEPTYLRQKYLRDQFYFTCKCSLCSDPTESGTYFSAAKCPVCSTGEDNSQQRSGYVIPLSPTDLDTAWACCQCKSEFSSSLFLSNLDEIEQSYWEFKYASLRKMNQKDRVNAIKAKIQELENKLHPCNFLIWKLKRYLLNALTERLVMMTPPTSWKEIKDIFTELERNALFVMTIIQIRHKGYTTERGECLYDLVAAYWGYIQWAVIFRKASSFRNHRNLKEFLRLLNETIVIFEPEVTGGNRVSDSVSFMKDHVNEINRKLLESGESITVEDGDCFEEDLV